jgi:hypothetical protein
VHGDRVGTHGKVTSIRVVWYRNYTFKMSSAQSGTPEGTPPELGKLVEQNSLWFSSSFLVLLPTDRSIGMKGSLCFIVCVTIILQRMMSS